MVDRARLNKLIDQRIGRVLGIVELVAPSDKFARVRSMILDEFGHEGLRTDIAELLDQGGQGGMERQGCGPVSGKKGGAP